MEHSAYCLDLHVAYQCRHAGVCCTAGWAIPIEGPAFETVTLHFARQAERETLFRFGGPLPEGAAAILGVRSNGACVFFEEDRGRLCAVHRQLGVDAMPVACRQFPRIVLQDARGTFISLSHYCPTAASLLQSPAPLQIVSAPAGLALAGDVEGLDARDALPPLLNSRLLMDYESYGAWERRAIGVLAACGETAASAVAMIAAVTRAIETWIPGGPSLRDEVEREFDRVVSIEEGDDLQADTRRFLLAVASVPTGLSPAGPVDDFDASWQEVSIWWRDYDRVVRAYLAARLFGNWISHYGNGLHAIVEYLRICLSVLKMEAARYHARSRREHTTSPVNTPWHNVLEPAIRNADLLLVHMSDTKALTRSLA